MPEEKIKREKEKRTKSPLEEAAPGAERAGAEQSREKASAPERSVSEQAAQERIAQEGEGSFEQGSGIANISTINQRKKARQKKIEKVLSDGLDETYKKMDPELQKRFKQKGEQTAVQINQMLDKAKVRSKKIMKMIRKWLSLIPGVNKFFLDQEAKIKADSIIEIKDEKNFDI